MMTKVLHFEIKQDNNNMSMKKINVLYNYHNEKKI